MDYSTLSKARPALVQSGAASAATLVIFVLDQLMPGALGPATAALLASAASLALARLAGSGDGDAMARSRAFGWCASSTSRRRRSQPAWCR